MKIVVFKSGLGNQLFVYLLCQHFRDKGQHVYSFSTKEWLSGHNGLEIGKWFDIDMPPHTWFTDIIANCVRACKKFFPHLIATDKNYYEEALYYDGYWQDKRFFLDNVSKIKFRNFVVDGKNQEMINLMNDNMVVSIHVRRGDYMDPKRSDIYSHSCPMSYYEDAISYAVQEFKHPVFAVFSDDMDWVKKNLTAVLDHEHCFIDWNKGENSFFDMYLMSECSAAIIANSSFSYWGALLGKKKVFVIRPKRWIGDWIPNIFPNDWIVK